MSKEQEDSGEGERRGDIQLLDNGGVIIQGWIKKKNLSGRGGGSWKLRYVKVFEDRLQYFVTGERTLIYFFYILLFFSDTDETCKGSFEFTPGLQPSFLPFDSIPSQ